MAEKPKTTPRAVGSSNIHALSTRPKTTTKKPDPVIQYTAKLTLADHFAMAALSGAVANKDVGHINVRQAQLLAESCYEIAEAMVAEKEKHGQ